MLRRLDHANIFLIIVGSYTPFALLLPRGPATILLTIVWAGALVGVLLRILWMDAPRWLYMPSYAALGLVAVFFVPLMREHLGVPTLTLVVVGGVLYILGAVVYGLRRPDPSPRWFGYHEIFHTLTILAFLTHYVAASLALYWRGAPSSGLTHDIGRGLVRSQPAPGRVAQPSIAGPLREPDLTDHRGLDPVRLARIVIRYRPGQWAGLLGERLQQLRQIAQ